jgi:uncharacterized protein YecT (DUF1311 family)
MPMTRSAAVMLVAGLLSLPSHAESQGPQGPSYPCTKAQTDTEKAICGDALLSALDLAMARAYQALLAAQPSQDSAIRSAQRDVITARDACDADSACITQVLEKRISAMLAMTGTSGGKPKPGAYDAIPANSEASLQVTLVDESAMTIDAAVVDSYSQHLCSMSGAVLGDPDNGGFVFVDNNDRPIAGAPIITALDNLLVLRGGGSFCGTNVSWPMIWSR